MEPFDVILPLKVEFESRGSDLRRCRIGLLPSILHSGAHKHIRIFRVVCPRSQMYRVGEMLGEFSSYFRFELRPDDDLVVGPILEGRFENSNAYIQQLIKLQSARLAGTRCFMTLDADIVFRDSFVPFLDRYRDTIPYHQEEASLHRNWWRASARALKHFRPLSGPVMGVTPEFLITDVANDLLDRLQRLAARRWLDHWQTYLMHSGLPWSEYSLYWTYYSKTRGVPQHHEACRIYHYCNSRQRALRAASDPNPAPVTIVQSSFINPEEFSEVVRAMGIVSR